MSGTSIKNHFYKMKRDIVITTHLKNIATLHTVNAPHPTRWVNFSAGRGHISRERDGLALSVSIIIMLDYI